MHIQEMKVFSRFKLSICMLRLIPKVKKHRLVEWLDGWMVRWCDGSQSKSFLDRFGQVNIEGSKKDAVTFTFR